MENDEYTQGFNINEREENSFNYYKLDYLNQSKNTSLNYRKWENSMKEKYGKNAKLFKCPLDKILFYTSYSNYISEPISKSFCPICKNQICYYCSRLNKPNIKVNNCCTKLKLKTMFSSDGYRYINSLVFGELMNTFKEAFIVFITPGLNYLLFCALIFKTLFSDVNINNTNEIFNEKIKTYDFYLIDKNSYIEITIIIIFALTISALYISFFILSLCLCLLLIICSFPFKLYPLKYILSFIFPL